MYFNLLDEGSNELTGWRNYRNIIVGIINNIVIKELYNKKKKL